MQTNSRTKLKSINPNISCSHYNAWKVRRFWIIVFTETGTLSDATSRATQQTHIDARRCDSKQSVDKMCEQDYFRWVGSRKMFSFWPIYCWWHILQRHKSLQKHHSLHMPDFASAARFSCVLSLFVKRDQTWPLKHTWPLICCVFHGNHKVHSAWKVFTHLTVAFWSCLK